VVRVRGIFLTFDFSQDAGPTRNANILVTPPARRVTTPDRTPPSGGSRAWETPVDIEKLERERKKLLVSGLFIGRTNAGLYSRHCCCYLCLGAPGGGSVCGTSIVLRGIQSVQWEREDGKASSENADDMQLSMSACTGISWYSPHVPSKHALRHMHDCVECDIGLLHRDCAAWSV
jgi:hypothetical protein